MKKILVPLLMIALVAVMVGAGTMAYFSDTKAETIQMSAAEVKIGERTGFPLKFENLTPGVWTGWQEASISSDSTIPMDVYVGTKSDPDRGDWDLRDILDVQIQRREAGEWLWVYNDDVTGLFAEWQKARGDMPVDRTDVYRVRVRLSEEVDNEDQGAWTYSWLLIYGVQAGGPVPDDEPWKTELD